MLLSSPREIGQGKKISWYEDGDTILRNEHNPSIAYAYGSLLFAAGFRPTPAKAMTVSWILKDGMQYVGKLICSNLGVRMDSEPKSWRVLGVDYYLGYSDLSRNQ